MIFERYERSIILLVELDILDALTAGSFAIRKVDLEHVGGEVLVEFYLSTATSRIHAYVAILLLITSSIISRIIIIIILMAAATTAADCQRLDDNFGWQKDRLHVRVVLQQVRFSFMFRF